MDPDLQILGLSYNSLGYSDPGYSGGGYGGGEELADVLGDVLGTLDPGVGAVALQRIARTNPMAAQRAMARARQSQGTNLRRILPQIPGVPAPGGRLQFLPIGAGAFVAGGLAVLPFNANPQRPFKGRRLVYVETRTGATATGLTTILNFFVGTNLQFVAANAMPAAAFAPTAFDTDMSLDPCGPGVNVTVNVAISALPTMTDRVDFSLAINGETLG